MKIFYKLRQNYIIFSIFVIFFPLSLFLLGVYLQEELSLQNKILTLALQKKQEKIKEIEEFQDIYVDSEKFLQYEEIHTQRLNFVKEKLPDKIYIEHFLHDVAKKAQTTSIKLVEVQIEDMIKENDMQKQMIKLHFEGDYFAVRAFIYELEQNMQFLEIQNLKIKASFQGANEEENLISEMDIILYARS